MNGLAVRPSTLIEVARRTAVGSQPFDPALREFLDEFHSDPQGRVSASADEPLLLDGLKDAYLAAVAEHLAMRFRLDIPAWTEDHGGH